MVEEAAGTSMYESKRDQTNKLIEKKDAKLNEMDAVSVKKIILSLWCHHRFPKTEFVSTIFVFVRGLSVPLSVLSLSVSLSSLIKIN